MAQRSVFIGYDSREQAAYAVAHRTARKFSPHFAYIQPIVLDEVRKLGYYTRPHVTKVNDNTGNTYTWDPISEASMSTEFAISRFLTPTLVKHENKQAGGDGEGKLGWALFMDCDVLVRGWLAMLFNHVEQHSDKALFCVQHKYDPPEGMKMDKQAQQRYARKNWSSVMLFNCDHPANDDLTLEMINGVPGRDLHRFCWLKDKYIGALDEKWNWLVGHSSPDVDPMIVHFTEGGPWFSEYRDVPYANEWLDQLLHHM